MTADAYWVEETGQPGVFAVFADVGGVPQKLAEVRSAEGRPVIVQDVTAALLLPGPAALVDLAKAQADAVAALDAAVTAQLRNVVWR